MATATAKPKAKGSASSTIRHASSLAIANGKTTAAKTAPVQTGASGYIRVTSDETLVVDRTVTQAETLKFAKQFPGWFAKLKPGPYAITICCNIAAKAPARKPAAKKPASGPKL